jgi:hypothetical protein
MGSYVGPRSGLDAVVRRKIPSTNRDLNSRSSSLKPSAIALSYPIGRAHIGDVRKSAEKYLNEC